MNGGEMQAAAPVAVRRAVHADARSIAEIYNEGIRGRGATFETRERAPAEIGTWIDSKYPVLVADRDGDVVGFIAASAYRTRECYAGISEFTIYVAGSARGQRVGDALMAAFLPVVREAGFWKVLSRIFPENTASLRLCERHGFRQVGTYEKHAQLDGVWRDVIIVERRLAPD